MMAAPKPAASNATSISSDSESSNELAAVVDDLLNQLSTKFSAVSGELLAKMDEMSKRLDSLEATIQAGEGGKGGSK